VSKTKVSRTDSSLVTVASQSGSNVCKVAVMVLYFVACIIGFMISVIIWSSNGNSDSSSHIIPVFAKVWLSTSFQTSLQQKTKQKLSSWPISLEINKTKNSCLYSKRHSTVTYKWSSFFQKR